MPVFMVFPVTKKTARKTGGGRPKTGRKPTQVRLSERTKERLALAQEKTHRGLSDYIEMALERQFEVDGIK